MKLIVVGATGFVGGEVVRQALRIPQFSSVVALSRRAIDPAPAEQGSATFKNVIVRDYDKYSEDVKKELAGAAACVW